MVRDHEAASSNLATPTNQYRESAPYGALSFLHSKDVLARITERENGSVTLARRANVLVQRAEGEEVPVLRME